MVSSIVIIVDILSIPQHLCGASSISTSVNRRANMNNRGLTKTTVIISGVLGFIASCIAIYGFVTGNLSLASIINQPQNSSTVQTQTWQSSSVQSPNVETPIITQPI